MTLPTQDLTELFLFEEKRQVQQDRTVSLHSVVFEEAIYQATDGLPRKINLLAHHTLLAAALTRAKLATADHVRAALPEIA